MELDRQAPARREACAGAPTGRQTWRDLLFLHWEVPVRTLRALVPAGLEIDTFDGKAYVGLVPFTMHDVRIGPLRVADFPEVNLRTYAHAGGVPPGTGKSHLAQAIGRAAIQQGHRVVYREALIEELARGPPQTVFR